MSASLVGSEMCIRDSLTSGSAQLPGETVSPSRRALGSRAVLGAQVVPEILPAASAPTAHPTQQRRAT
eukprot:4084780-Alexandrium_andersonii.AAC.1